MSRDETINGEPVTEEQIARWSAEAETGYDVSGLKRLSRGRPGKGAEPLEVVAVKLTTQEIVAIDRIAERDGKTRSEVIRHALNALCREP